MKSLLIIRHAKSSWDQAILNDFDRPLNDRGKKNVVEMAKRLLRKKINIDLFISSPAKRAKKTAEGFVKEFNGNADDILFIPALYHASVQTFSEVIKNVDDKYNCIALFSHNPGITAFVNTLTEVKIDNMPTCGIFALSVDTDAWQAFDTEKKTFLFFDYPKSEPTDD